MGSGISFKGTITVTLSSNFLEASWKLTKGGDLVYDQGAVLRTLNDAGVKEGFDEDELVERLQNFQKSKDSERTEVIARGSAPESPRSEDWVWEEGLSLPEEWSAMSTRVLAKAGPPEIFSVRMEKVLVDPKVEKVFYVEAGFRVARLIPPKPGKAGRDLTGKVLPPPTTQAGIFYAGKNLEVQKTEVTSDVQGFLRIGKSWADIVPFSAHRWEVTYSSDRSNAFFTFQLGHPDAPALKAAEVLAKLKVDRFPLDKVLPEETLQKMIDTAVLQKTSVISQPITSDRDSSFTITFTPDRTKALLNLQKNQGSGKPLSLKELGDALREARLKNFNFETVKTAIMEFVKGSGTELRDFVLVQGKAPTRGKDKELVFLIDFMTKEELSAIQTKTEANLKILEAIPERNVLSLAQVLKAAPVSAGQKFALVQPPEGGLGDPGMDIDGALIPPIPGNDPSLRLLSQVRRIGDTLEAVQDGLLEIGEDEGTTILRVRNHQDARVIVQRSEDNMQAFLTLLQGRGSGNRLEKKGIDEALEAEQVSSGLDQAKIEEAFQTASAGQKVESWLIARGKPGGSALEKRLIFLMPLRNNASGNRTALVREGQKVADYQPPSEDNAQGVDVLGNPIPDLGDEALPLRISSEYEVKSEENGMQSILALRGGELVFDGAYLSLNHQITVGPLTAKTGSLKFPGEVIVTGNIDSGLYVVAGNLKIKGQVAGALLSSEAFVQVTEGVRGEGKAVLRAKKHVSLGFIEKAVVLVVGDLHVLKTISHCSIRCNGRIFQKSAGGSLSGGLAKTKSGLDVMNLGSPNGVPTVISFGQDYLVEDQINAEVKETDKLRQGIVNLDVLLKRTRPEDKDKLTNLRQKKVLMLKMLDKRNLKLINLRDKFDLHCPSEIIVRENLYPGVSIESHGRVYEVKAKKSALRIVFNENTGHIEEQPL